ncbi:MFS transporter [Thalassolituus marinus]|uniref:MFS transporter n=1 Tax=Thalassolituus marinus TaxID=671053 RepID=A0ABS7ZR52_9GAMM|nr:MFS transporter [Thalassolituus marinus]MCA6063663.1 MFS transporter [Thalassolituus marinus]
MIPLILPITALLSGVALLLLGTGLLNTLLALRGASEGYSDTTMGLIMSGYFVGFFLGTYLALPLISRMGHIRAFAFCAALVASSVLLHVLVVDPIAWGLCRVLTGTALVILYTVIESWLNAQTPADQRGRVFAVYMVVNLAALALAQQFLQFGSAQNFALFAIAAILVSLSLMPVTWTRVHQPEVHDVQRASVRNLYKTAPVALGGALLSGLAMGAFWGLGAVYAARSGLNDHQVATFMSCAIIGGALLQYPLGRYSDRHDRRRVIAVVAGLAALAALVLIPLSASVSGLMLGIAVYGGLAFAIYPLAVAHLVDHLEARDILAGGSGLLLVHGIGAATGPALAGWLMGQTGANALPVWFCVMQGLLVLVAVRNLHTLIEEEPESPSAFVPMVRTTPTALEMLPEEEGLTVSDVGDDAQTAQEVSSASGH